MPAQPPDETIALAPGDALFDLDEMFHTTYAGRRQSTRAGMGPVLAQIDDLLILRIRDQRLQGPARTRRYHELKAISHVPITIYLLLEDVGEGPLDESQLERTRALRDKLAAVMADLTTRSFEGDVLTRQRRLLQAGAELLDKVLDARRVAGEECRRFVRDTTPDIIRNMDDAARDQLETMHATLTAWMKDMTPEERSSLQAVVAVSHMSRPGNVGVQYLSLALGEHWEGRFDREDLKPGRRVIASEVTTDEDAALTLLATHELDARIAHSFFREQSRMDRDLLADASERILARMFGRTPEHP